MFWFLFYNSFDATYLYEYTFILGYNLFFTSLPVIVLGGMLRAASQYPFSLTVI
jgi:phospholipid-translocating ATPase